MSNENFSTTIEFYDFESSDEALAIVRQVEERVALALSIRGDGDIDVLLNSATAKKLAEALLQACEADDTDGT